ncbi:MAG: hypothetical protein AAGI01_06585 [Myxococcota bacterium]
MANNNTRAPEDAPVAEERAAQTEEHETAIVRALDPALDTREGAEPSLWEERFEARINTFFDEAIARVPGFVDRNLKSLRRIMGRSLSPTTGVGDIFIGVRNLFSGVSKSVGGPEFSTTTFTHDKLTESFAREVVSSQELESLLNVLFMEFEEEQLSRLAEALGVADEESAIDAVRARLVLLMEQEIGHDPLLAQAIRSGVKIGLPATLGYVLFSKFTFGETLGSKSVAEVYKRRLTFYHRVLTKLGKFEIPSWLGAVGWAGGVVGSLAIGGLMEYALNSVRDIKGAYIRQLNTARYILLYGENPEETMGQGLLHIVRGLERQFERAQDLGQLITEGDAQPSVSEG